VFQEMNHDASILKFSMTAFPSLQKKLS
jgi:hypothetical protein